jgi:hypothetical protein
MNQRHCAVYYVTKNNALKNAASLYDLKRAKLAKSAATNDSDTKQVTKNTKRENKAKRETKKAIAQIAAHEENKLSESQSSEALALMNTNDTNAAQSNTQSNTQ